MGRPKKGINSEMFSGVKQEEEVVLDPKQEEEVEMTVFWDGHAVVEKMEEKMTGEKKYFVCKCDDGCTYDVPAELF